MRWKIQSDAETLRKNRPTTWVNKNRNKFLHIKNQNELIELMALKILKDIAKDINKSVVSDKITDSANDEEFVIYFSWID